MAVSGINDAYEYSDPKAIVARIKKAGGVKVLQQARNAFPNNSPVRANFDKALVPL